MLNPPPEFYHRSALAPSSAPATRTKLVRPLATLVRARLPELPRQTDMRNVLPKVLDGVEQGERGGDVVREAGVRSHVRFAVGRPVDIPGVVQQPEELRAELV